MKLQQIGGILIAIGVALAFFTDKSAVTIASMTLGVCGYAFSEVLPRLKGRFEFGPKGLKGTLAAAVVEEVTAKKAFVSVQASDDLALPSIELRANSSVLELAVGGGVAIPLMSGDQLEQSIAYRTETGETFRVKIPLIFKSTDARPAEPVLQADGPASGRSAA